MTEEVEQVKVIYMPSPTEEKVLSVCHVLQATHITETGETHPLVLGKRRDRMLTVLVELVESYTEDEVGSED